MGEPPPTDTPTVTPTIDDGQQGPDLGIVKTLEGRLMIGQEATYRLDVYNAGTVASTGTITVTDPIPQGLVMVSVHTPSGWDCMTSSPQFVLCTYPHPMLPGEPPQSIFIVVEVLPSATSNIVNVATVSIDTIDLNPDNDSASTSDPILPPPAPAPVLSPTAVGGALLVLLAVARSRLRPGRRS